MSDTVQRCRAILAAAKTANDNKFDFRFARQCRVDELLAQLNAHKVRDWVYSRDDTHQGAA